MQPDQAATCPFHSNRIQGALALAICLVVVLMQTLAPEFRRPVADSMLYAKIIATLADQLLHDPGQFNQTLGTFFGPVYLVSVAVLAALDADLAAALSCVAKDGAVCDLGGLTILFAVQGIAVALTVFFCFLAIRRLAVDGWTPWLALVVLLASKSFSNYASLILTETAAFFFFALFGWLFARFLTDREVPWWQVAAMGVALAGAVLTRASYLYLAYFMVAVVVLWARAGAGRSWRAAIGMGAAFALGVAIVLGPWWLRNYVTFDLAGVSGGYGPRVMVERLAYNAMTWREWGVSFIYWLPDFGDGLASALFQEELWKRLTWYGSDSFYMMGRGPFFQEVYAASGQHPSALGYLLREYVWGDLAKHLAVTLSLAARGQWVGKYIGFVGFLMLPVCFWVLRRRGKALPFLVFCLPPYFMLGLYAFVSVNVTRYNVPLIAVFALSIATVLVQAARWGVARFRRTPRTQ